MTRMLTAVFMGGQRAGLVGLLAAAQALDIVAVVTHDADLWRVAADLGYPLLPTLHEIPVAHVLVSVHGRSIAPDDLLARFAYGGINVHPCLWKYPGADPVGRWLAGTAQHASVGAHVMTAIVDGGPRICEAFVEMARPMTRAQVYRRLYPVYGFVVRRALDSILQAEYGVFNPWSATTPTPPFVRVVVEGSPNESVDATIAAMAHREAEAEKIRAAYGKPRAYKDNYLRPLWRREPQASETEPMTS